MFRENVSIQGAETMPLYDKTIQNQEAQLKLQDNKQEESCKNNFEKKNNAYEKNHNLLLAVH